MKTLRVLKWLFINAGLAACAYYAVIENNEGFARLYQFYAWVGHTCSFITAFNDDLREQALKRDPTPAVPLWLNNSIDTALCLFFVYHGWWMTAIATLLSVLALEKLYEKKEE